ncbi:MAG: alpha/beta hydrolase [Rhodospirillaceae bacterium]|mgnify:FL=1|jgi:pimeloyl-ACP methyl ester carboxylesterase|nr:alpha/beta hydrolase [Rhodospirillaceae bacterium]MBT5083016.1 alpha/beta hydrolase [Rhodospirillaceae bacterium]MBT5524460.1 alpha/beta hydrolase [Rhodospirillaceae bacterium]MBT5878744.1 alpha/beta hydrolase [Rhodospirillaceae bacterium]MBT6590345.1 alpha/beta hydrolase [Rhodospirillaceae bacterium]
MANIVLIHGAWHGGWCWRLVRQDLEARGHKVFTPSLTGLGDRVHLMHVEVDLETHINDVVGLIEAEELDDVILCGHSYGGMVITGVADAVGDRIKSLVYLDALVPENGQSALSLLSPEGAESFRKKAASTGDGWKIPPIPAAAFGVTDPDLAAWIDRRCVPHPLASMEQPLALTHPARRDIPCTYILAEDFPNFKPVHARLAEDPAWTCHSLPCGHDVMAIMPKELSDILDGRSI